jgi:hypothetical protein
MTQVDDDIKFGMIEAISHLIHRDYEAIVQVGRGFSGFLSGGHLQGYRIAGYSQSLFVCCPKMEMLRGLCSCEGLSI